MRIGLDIDGPCADFGPWFLKYLGLDPTPATDWDDPRFRDNINRVDHDHTFWLNVPPSIKGHTIPFPVYLYCTARNVATYVTKQYLNENNFPDAPVITVGMGNSKLHHLFGNVDVFIDDSIRTFEELNDGGVPCILFTRAHNRHYDAGEMRVDSLYEFHERFIINNEEIQR